MNHVPTLIRSNNSRRRTSLVSEITFDDDDFLSGEISYGSTGSKCDGSKCDHKWSAGTQPCHAVLESRRIFILTSMPHSTSLAMPERKCSTNRLSDRPVEDANNVTLKPLRSKHQEENPTDKFWRSKRLLLSQLPGALAPGSKDRMPNAKWDLGVTGSGLEVKESLSSGCSSDGRQSCPNRKFFSKVRTSFSRRISACGPSVELRKPIRRRSKDRDLEETSDLARNMIPTPIMPIFPLPGRSSFVLSKKHSIASPHKGEGACHLMPPCR
ncbi:unnamed protein product [Cylindrotheca closterium]|uniref:Uncharacterized protein n=1 Tax=Cylindrotheca closterium TaxID=2856 RepID=A0AAD2FPB7_9STRA|nr:unnamed protein product [Cylindrotheca closterium]